MSALFRGPVPEHLPGEPARRVLPGWAIAALVPIRAAVTAALLVASLPAWLVLGLTVLRWGRPPLLVRASQVVRFLRLILTVDAPAPGLSAARRAWLVLAVLHHVAVAPWWALAWQLDEALYDLDAVAVRAPLFEISAGRSGSTQLARYLEDDPSLLAPSLLQIQLPFRWMWWIAGHTVGRWVRPETVQRLAAAALPPEMVERHELDPLRTDTADGALYASHLFHLAPNLGPSVIIREFGFASQSPDNAAAWDEDLPAIVDGLARKLLLDHPGRRFFLKGHFLRGAEPLSRRFPDAILLAVVRDPVSRLQSGVNYPRSNPADPVLGPVPWGWWAEGLCGTEAAYCELEQAWFSVGPRRYVVPFKAFVHDLPGTMAWVYRSCLGVESLPAHVPREHPPWERTRYLVNRSLAEVGIDQEAWAAQVAAYRAWLARLEAAGLSGPG